ncbi:alpha/beta hydrolase [Streptomyces sp. NPDC054854]
MMITRRSVLLLAGSAAGGMLLPATAAQAAAALPLPAPTAPRPIGTRTLHLVDTAREDPFAPDRRPRELMVQLWYPALGRAGRPRAPYTTAAVAADLESGLPLTTGTLAAVRPHARDGAPAAHGPLPLLLLGHGREGGRANCTALAEDLAAHGYLVAAVDHTFDAAVVEFPGGRIIRGVLPEEPADWDAQERLEIRARVDDLRFLAGELPRPRGGTGGWEWPRADPARIGVLGHSMGGSAAAEALRVDRRFRAGLGLDGALFGSPVAEQGLDRPYMLLTTLEDHDTWRQWREHQRGWARQVRIAGAGHLTFTDLPHFAAAGGLPQAWPTDLYAELLGTLTPARSAQLVRAYTRAFFDRFLRNLPSPLLDGPSPRFPEAEFRWSHPGTGTR